MQHEDYKEMLAIEAAGALDVKERDALEEHLRSCAECRAELIELSDAAAFLAYTILPVRPPLALRSRILESVHASSVQTQNVSARLAATDGSSEVENRVVADGANTQRMPLKTEDVRGLVARLSLWQIFAARPSFGFGALAAAVAVVALGVATFSLWNRTESLRGEVARLNERLGRSESELAGERGQLARISAENDILSAPGARVAQLAGKEAAPGARAVIAYDRTSGRAMLITSGLPSAPQGKAYQLWLIAEGKPLPGGTFKTDPEGRARMSDQLPAGMGDKAAFAITLEREGGEMSPKGAIYLISSAS